MKKMYTQPVQFLRLFFCAAIGLAYALAPSTAHGQTYYSNFFNTTGKFSITEPSGGTCNAPSIQDAAVFADANINNYSYFNCNISSPLTCTDKNYIINAYLKLLPDSQYISGKMQAGFRVRIPSGINVAKLKKYITIQSYLGNTLQQSYTGDSMHIIDLGTDNSRFILYINTSKNFNRMQMIVNSDIIPLNTDFEFQINYAIASNLDLLPVTISSHKATMSGNNVTVSWLSVNEINLSGYRIEKSANNGSSYTAVATIPAKGGSGAINYSYTDKAVANGNYLYRIVALDKDGSAKPTDAMLVTMAEKAYLVLMPSIVKAGQNVVVNNTATGSYQLSVFDLQGRILKQQQVNNGDRPTINTGGLSAGTYVVKIMTASGNMYQAKFVVN